MREGFCKTVTAMVIGAASALGVGIPLAALILFLMMALARGNHWGKPCLVPTLRCGASILRGASILHGRAASF
jgi:hypothetical protein